MAVSREDRAYFARIGVYEDASHRAASEAHLQLPVADRLRKSWELYETFGRRGSARPFDDGALALYARARELGLYRP